MSHKKFGPDRFSRFDVYWIQTNRHPNKQTDRQAKFIYRFRSGNCPNLQYPKWKLPKFTISEVGTAQIYIIQGSNFPNVQYPGHIPNCFFPNSAWLLNNCKNLFFLQTIPYGEIYKLFYLKIIHIKKLFGI